MLCVCVCWRQADSAQALTCALYLLPFAFYLLPITFRVCLPPFVDRGSRVWRIWHPASSVRWNESGRAGDQARAAAVLRCGCYSNSATPSPFLFLFLFQFQFLSLFAAGQSRLTGLLSGWLTSSQAQAARESIWLAEARASSLEQRSRCIQMHLALWLFAFGRPPPPQRFSANSSKRGLRRPTLASAPESSPSAR